RTMQSQSQAVSEPSPGSPSLILTPLYDDWDALAKLVARLDEVLAAHQREVDMLIADDASVLEPDAASRPGGYRAIGRIDVLHLRRNLGHQRAIAIGLAYIHDRLERPY